MWIRQEVPKLKVKKHYGNPSLLTIAEFVEVNLATIITLAKIERFAMFEGPYELTFYYLS